MSFMKFNLKFLKSLRQDKPLHDEYVRTLSLLQVQNEQVEIIQKQITEQGKAIEAMRRKVYRDAEKETTDVYKAPQLNELNIRPGDPPHNGGGL